MRKQIVSSCAFLVIAGQAYAEQEERCSWVQREIRENDAGKIRLIHQGMKRSEQAMDKVAAYPARFNDAARQYRQLYDAYWEFIRELETLLVIRRELDCRVAPTRKQP